MIVLGIDTSTDFLSTSIIEDKKVLSQARIWRKQGHSDYLIPLIDRLLRKADLSLKQINGFAVSKGPGSFTGLRIGVTATRALALVTARPIIGVPTLDVIAYNVKKPDTALICPILDAKQNKVYACIFKNKNGVMRRRSRYLLLPVEGLSDYIEKQPVTFLGDGIKIYKEYLQQKLGPKAIFLDEKFWYPDATWVAKLGLWALKKGKKDSPYDLVPMYIYPKECTVSTKYKVKS